MNFPLKNLENHLKESWLLSGEELHEEGAVSGLVELERNLWVGRVKDREVEVQLSPSRVKAYSCDCPEFKKEKGCGHIAAALFYLRNLLRQRLEVKEPVKKPLSDKKISFLQHLQLIPSDDLIDFVRDYARQNRPFALALKARFTGSLPLEDRREKYLELLDSAITGIRNKKDQVGFRGALQLAQVVRELLNQAEEAISGNHPKEASILLTSVLEKVGPLARKTTGKDNKLQQTLKDGFALFKQILLLKPAPELLQMIWEFCMGESRKFIYRQSPIQADYLNLLGELAPSLGKTEELLGHFKAINSDLDPKDPNRPDILILIHKLLVLQGDVTKIQENLLDHLHEPSLVLYAVEEALATGHWKKARFLAEKGLESSNTSALSGRLEEHLFELALKEKDREAVIQFGVSRFLQSKKPHYLEHIRKFARKEWPQLAEELLEKLEAQPYSLHKRDAIARLMYDEGRFDSLFQYIVRLQSLDLLQQYGKQWPPERAEEAERLFMEILPGYLNNHLGRKPSQRVREVLENLFEAGMNEVADKLLARFRTDFSARQSLMEELETFHS